MAKVPYSKLGLTKNIETKIIDWNNQKIEVLQYLPIDEKTQLFERVLQSSVDDNHYYNITKVNFWLDLEIVFTYTNISFTEKQKEDLCKLYDIIKGSGLLKAVKDNMDKEELAEIVETVWDTIKNLYAYHNSAMGIMEAVTADYSNLNLESNEIRENISNPENLNLLRDVLTKLG